MSGCHPQANLTRITMTCQTEESCCGLVFLLRWRVNRSPVSSHIIAKVAHTGALWPSSSRSLLNNCLCAHLPAAATLLSTRCIVERDLTEFDSRGKITFYLLGEQFCKICAPRTIMQKTDIRSFLDCENPIGPYGPYRPIREPGWRKSLGPGSWK